MTNGPPIDPLKVAAALPAALAANLAAPPDTVPARIDPVPRKISLPLGGDMLAYTREHLTHLYRCSHGELGRLLSRRMGPLPIRVDGAILWWVDECLAYQAQVLRTLERWRKR